MPLLECPKCKSQSSWLVRDRTDVTHRCLCGYCKVIQTTLESATINFSDVSEVVELPGRGSNMSKLLHLVAAEAGLSSQEITARFSQILGRERTVSDVSSYLTFLKSKGLVEQLEVRRGLAGGSTWKVTEACQAKMEG